MALTRSELGRRPLTVEWARRGAIMGIIAGIVFAMFEMIMAALMGDGFWMPLRMIGAIALGDGALEPTYSLLAAGAAGLLVHVLLSALYGLAFGVVAGSIPALRTNAVMLVIAASIFGLALWIVNFYVFAPLAFTWFEMADPLVQFVAHTFFFGAALGILMTIRGSREAEL